MTTLAQARPGAVPVKTQELRYERHEAARGGNRDPVVMLLPGSAAPAFGITQSQPCLIAKDLSSTFIP